MKKLTIIGTSLFILTVLFWIFCLNHISVGHIGVAYNPLNGSYVVQKEPGWYVTSPFVEATSISTIPFVTSINYNNNNSFSYNRPKTIKNLKLIAFDPDGIDAFIKMHGFHYYGNDTYGLENMLSTYAIVGEKYPFIKIVEEFK